MPTQRASQRGGPGQSVFSLRLALHNGGPLMSAHRITITLLVLTVFAAPAAAVVTQQTYQINPGGVYHYLPSPEGPGIAGGMPNNYQLDFGIGGRFVYEFDTAGPT